MGGVRHNADEVSDSMNQEVLGPTVVVAEGTIPPSFIATIVTMSPNADNTSKQHEMLQPFPISDMPPPSNGTISSSTPIDIYYEEIP